MICRILKPALLRPRHNMKACFARKYGCLYLRSGAGCAGRPSGILSPSARSLPSIPPSLHWPRWIASQRRANIKLAANRNKAQFVSLKKPVEMMSPASATTDIPASTSSISPDVLVMVSLSPAVPVSAILSAIVGEKLSPPSISQDQLHQADYLPACCQVSTHLCPSHRLLAHQMPDGRHVRREAAMRTCADNRQIRALTCPL